MVALVVAVSDVHHTRLCKSLVHAGMYKSLVHDHDDYDYDAAAHVMVFIQFKITTTNDDR